MLAIMGMIIFLACLAIVVIVITQNNIQSEATKAMEDAKDLVASCHRQVWQTVDFLIQSLGKKSFTPEEDMNWHRIFDMTEHFNNVEISYLVEDIVSGKTSRIKTGSNRLTEARLALTNKVDAFKVNLDESKATKTS